jgi:hypothetical protein
VGGPGNSTGNTIVNFGGGDFPNEPAAGVRIRYQWEVNVSNNDIYNNDGGGNNHANTLHGIYAQDGNNADISINNNRITLHGGDSITHVTFIENSIGSSGTTNTVNINGNILTGDYLTATTGFLYGIYNRAGAAQVNINGNYIYDLTYSASDLLGAGFVYGIYDWTGAIHATVNNNIIENISRIGTNGGTTIGIYLQSGINQTVTHNTVTNMSIDGSGTQCSMIGIRAAGRGTVAINYNTISNLICLKIEGTSELYGIWENLNPEVDDYSYNTVSYLTHAGSGPVYGIYANTTIGTRTMSYNTVHSISGAGNSIAGINNAQSYPEIFGNKIYNIQSTSDAAPVVSGILQTSISPSGYANIYNNIVGDIKAPNATSSGPGSPSVRGINIAATSESSSLNVSFNTVYLNAGNNGTNFGTAGLYVTGSGTGTTTELTLRNNIIINESTPLGTGLTVAYQRSSASQANYSETSNNNLFFAGTPGPSNLIYYDGTNSCQSLASFKTLVAPRESLSVTEDALFESTTGGAANYLHISPSAPSQAESGGIMVKNITDDFDGQIRYGETGYAGSGGAPDIGADEFDGIPSDFSAPNITYVPLTSVIVAPTRTFEDVSITDPSGVDTASGTRPRVYFKRKTDGNIWNDNTSATDGWKWAEANGTTSPFTFTIDYSLLNGGTGIMVGDTVQYFVVAEDLNGVPNVGTNSGTFATAPASVALTGTAFPIGGSINYFRVTTIIAGTKSVGTGGDYPSLTGTGGLFEDINNKVVAGNITVDILSDLAETGLHALNQWVEDGTGGYSLTIRPGSASNYTISGNYSGGLIRLNGADRVTIDGRYSGSGRYLTIANTSSSANTAAIQILSLGPGAGAADNTFRNCQILAGTNTVASTFGIFAGGTIISTTGTGADNDNLSVLDNVIKRCGYGIYARGTVPAGELDMPICSGNTIGSDIASEYVTNYGISLQSVTGATVAENEIYNMIYNTAKYGMWLGTYVNNCTISKNKIHTFSQTGTTNYPTYGIFFSSSIGVVNNQLDNNLIFGLNNHGSTSFLREFNLAGIRIAGGDGYKLYYNAVSMSGAFGSTMTALPSGCLYISNPSTNMEVRNNIFSNTRTGNGPRSYTIFTGFGTTFNDINHNAYYSTSAYMGYFGEAIANFGAWQQATGQDSESINTNPLCISNTDLHLQSGSPCKGEAFVLEAVDVDHDGNPRHPFKPTIGAYDYPPPGFYMWTGQVDNNWNAAGNWSPNGVPGINDDAGVPTTPAGGTVFPIVPASGGPFSVDELYIGPNATLAIPNGATLNVNNTSP